MGKIVVMIPARLGSKRVRGKNLRLLAGKPLICHVVEQAKQSGVFDEIYINSEGDIFEKIARECGVRFYKRPLALAADDATNDDFAHDFMNNVGCSILAQINPTSPLTRADQMRDFIKMMTEKNYDAMLSVKKEQVEGFFNEKPINFDPTKQMPRSQDLTPIYLHCSNMFAWKTDVYKANMKKYGCAVYGANAKTGYFVFDPISAIDIDNEDDFDLAELALEFVSRGSQEREPKYYES